MSETHQHDFWLLPSHEDLTEQVLSAIDEIAAIDLEIRNAKGSRPELRDKRRQKVRDKSQGFRRAINDACSRGDARFVSNFYTHIASQTEVRLRNDKPKRDIWRELFDGFLPNYPPSIVQAEHFVPGPYALDCLADGSWLLSLGFRLKNAFTSKSETAFHFSNNPIVRDHLTGLPLVKPTTWKGHLRFAARMASTPETLIHRLFGETLGDEGGRAGRLHFFPTFFTTDVEREVVTPLKRSTRTPAPGRGPIDIEVIPNGSRGTFCLLYLPHPRGPGWSPGQIADDMEAVAPALKAMFLDYGFSAKKTAGWGVVEDTVSGGTLWARGPTWPAPAKRASGAAGPAFRLPEDAFLPLLDEARMPRSILRKPDGAWLSNSEFNALGEKPSSLNVYKRFHRWYDVHGAEWRRRLAGDEVTWAVPVRTYPVESVTALCDLAIRLARAVRAESANG
ncbi:MAG: hypothetical protein HY690_05155 [Chloroflexi bacterium]|nr:hypothetical protein [Chloroflexota bacterium]